MFVRPTVFQGGFQRPARVGDGMMATPVITTIATAGSLTMPVAGVLGGILQYTGAAGAVAYTLPLAADLIAAMPDMDIGDSYMFIMVNTAAQNATNTTNTGITLSGNSAVVNASRAFIVLTKTAATTMNAVVL